MRLRNWDRKVLSVSGNAKQVCLLESSLDHTDSWKRTYMQLIEVEKARQQNCTWRTGNYDMI